MRQGCTVVDAVACHCHFPAFFLQAADKGGLILRQHPRPIMEDAGFACNLPGSGFVVARQHIDFDAGGLQFADGLYGALFYLICNPGYGKRVFTVGKPDDGLRIRSQAGGFIA